MERERHAGARDDGHVGDAVPDERATRPVFWRIASGVMYAEMPLSGAIRPPLLTEWESRRVVAFRNRERRARWLAGRALAKVLVKERLSLPGVVEIREGADGEPLVYENGYPRADVWLGIAVRHGRICCVLGDRPVSLDLRRVDDAEVAVVDRFVDRAEQRTLRRVLGSARSARSAAWAIKEAAQRAARSRDRMELRDVHIGADYGVGVGDDANLHVLALRVHADVAVAVVGRMRLEEEHRVRVVLDDQAREEATPRLQAALERSVAKARRIADARMRWQQVRFQG